MVGSFRRIIVALIPGCLAIGDVSFFFSSISAVNFLVTSWNALL
jgi:hypothetical protein